MAIKLYDFILYNTEYDIIYADPPWKQKKGGIRKCRPNQKRNLDYETIELKDIEDIIRGVKKSENHILFIWTIDKFLIETEKMFNDYRLHARIIWDKGNGIAPAFTVRYTHEYLLWFYKEKMIPINKDFRGKYTTILREKSRKHSQKPISAYEMIENLYPKQSKIELFARNRREGWSSWGNEL